VSVSNGGFIVAAIVCFRIPWIENVLIEESVWKNSLKPLVNKMEDVHVE
jgi:hypothetical protein